MESENADSWGKKFSHLRLAMGEAFLEQIVAISDRDKSLDCGLNDLGLSGTLTYLIFCQHLQKNVIKRKGGSAITGHFWRDARAKTEEKFHYHMTKLRQASAIAAAYLEAIDPTSYAEAYVPCQRFGHGTSNVAESVNSLLKQDRQEDVLFFLSKLWDRAMMFRHSRFCQALKNIDEERYYTPHRVKLITQSRGLSGGCCVPMSTDSKAKVITPEGWIYDVEVDWEARKCHFSCRWPWQTELLCVHVMAMLFDQHKTLDGFYPLDLQP